MTELQYTLLSDGSSDRVLMPILTWLLHQHLPQCAVQPRWADLGRLRKPPRELYEKIRKAVDLYPCHIIFVHRDAETASLQDRQREVEETVNLACQTVAIPPAVAVIPVRMIEAWLLFDAPAIRAAAGNPNGVVDLNLPRLTEVENIPNPKSVLHRAILDATEKNARRQKRFDVNRAVHLIPQRIDDFAPLRKLSAFAAVEERIIGMMAERKWRE